jgi:hypothetical protein
MKIVAIILALIVFVGMLLLACPKGTVNYEGVCADLPSPDESTLAPAVGVVSDEKPSRHPEPAYQRGEVTADMPESQVAEDTKMDQEKAQADIEGKKAAGLMGEPIK